MNKLEIALVYLNISGTNVEQKVAERNSFFSPTPRNR